MTTTHTAWDLVGFPRNEDEDHQQVRVVGGHTLYEAVGFQDNTAGHRVRLSRLETRLGGLRQINRYVDPDTILEVVPDQPEGATS